MRPLGIRENLRRSIDKLVMREARDQANTTCGSFQICAGIEAVIEEATHSVANWQRERHTPDPEVRAYKALEGAEYGREAASGRKEITGGPYTVRGMGEVLRLP